MKYKNNFINMRYSKQIAAKVNVRIPKEVREALLELGWNEFGIYEAVLEAILEAEKEKK